MPAYEFRCHTCGDVFVVRRGMSESTIAPAPCPDGHTDTTRIFTPVAVGGRAGNGGSAPSHPPVATPVAGSCCGGGCCG
jgi:putative FmdB family regulatory protein